MGFFDVARQLLPSGSDCDTLWLLKTKFELNSELVNSGRSIEPLVSSASN